MTKQTTAGFTLIEMLLAMAFVSFLMVTIALTSISMARTYQRGMTLSDVNAAGRTLTTDIQRTVSQAPAGTSTDASKNMSPFATKNLPTSGALCLGSYSYVWNNAASLADPASRGQLVKYQGTSTPVRLARVLDPQKIECSATTIAAPAQANSTELLPVGSGNGYNGLALHKFAGAASALSITPITADTSQALYQVDFALGTDDMTALNLGSSIQSSGCKPPSDSNSNLNYCAINHFSFIVRAGGGVYDASTK